MHVYSKATYAGALRPTALCQRRLAPSGIAWPQLRLSPSRGAPPADAADRLLESMRGAACLSDWLSHLPWTLLGAAGSTCLEDEHSKDLRCTVLDTLRHLCSCHDSPTRSAAAWAAQLLAEQDRAPAASAWHLWDAMDSAFDANQPFQMPAQPVLERTEALSRAAPPADDPSPSTAAAPQLPTADGPMLATSSSAQVSCAAVATSLFIHLDSDETRANRSFVNLCEVDAIVQLLLAHGRVWLKEGYSIRILCTYLAQASLVRTALEHYYDKARSDDKPDLHPLLTIPISTVDSAQGTEADIVLASLVRANSRHSTGFVGDARRSNVLLSRARLAQITFGHGPTLAACNWNDYAALFAIFEELGGLLAAAPDHYWHPATVTDISDRRGRSRLPLVTPRLSDALDKVISTTTGRGALSAHPLAGNLGALLAKLEGCTRDPAQVRRAAAERAGKSPDEPTPAPPEQ